jgi:ComF family protein
MQLVKELAQGFSHLLFPKLCEGCNSPLMKGEDVLCLQCESLLPFTHYHHLPENETVLRLSGRVPFRHATSLAYFTQQSLLQHLIHGLKYKDRRQNGIFLGKELGKAIAPLHWGIDAVVAVPLHRKKEAKRGYNQSSFIAEGIAAVLNIPVLENVIVRSRFTESQTDKTREQRIENVSKAFEIRKPDVIKGKHLLLTDDVLTTGATLESCALSLLSVPQVSVSIATIGIAK